MPQARSMLLIYQSIRETHPEVDEESTRYARNNISRNNLTDRIEVFQVPSDGSILPAAVFE